MKEENINALESLSKTAYRSGILPVFLGILILFIGAVNNETTTILTGLFVFIVGYSFVKISSKISNVLKSEKN